MSALQFIEQAQTAYSEKRYRDAVKLLHQALSCKSCSTQVRLNALDARSQCYCRLGEYDLALQDARNMLHVSKKRSPDGYVRCSQIERLLGNHTAATKWLEHGMRNVPQQQRVFQAQLQKVKDSAGKHVANQKRRDPIAAVPLEILQLILSYLDYRLVVKLLLVSRTWQRLLSRLPPLTNTIDFTQARRKVSYQACHAALRRLCAHPQKILLYELVPSALSVMQLWLHKYPHLETLEILSFGNSDLSLGGIRFNKLLKVKSLSLGALQKVSLEQVLRIITTCRTLQDATVHVTSRGNTTLMQGHVHQHLQHLRLVINSIQSFTNPTEYFQTFPNLRGLSINGGRFEPSRLDLSTHTHLSKLQLSLPPQLPIELVLPNSIETLDCTGFSTSSASVIFIVAEPVTLQNLRTISLEDSSAAAIIHLLENSSIPPILQTINLVNLPPSCLDQMARQGFQVMQACRRLSFYSEQLEDRHLDSFVALFPAIEELMLEAPLLSGVFVSDLVQRASSRLSKVVLQDCIKMSRDIQDWLKSQNIECRIRKAAQENRNARRLRDSW